MDFLARITQRLHYAQKTFWPSVVAVVIVAFTVRANGLQAKEQAEEFVKGLQDRGLHDLAQEYLDQLSTNPLADDATRKRVPYLRGMAIIEQSRQTADLSLRNRLLDDARNALEKYAETNPDSVQGAEAQLELATVQLSRGQELLAQMAQLPKEPAYDPQRRKLGRDARVHFAEARETYQRAEGVFSKELEKLPPTSNTEGREEATSRRVELRGRVAQLRFLAAQTQYETAQSYPKGGDEFRKLNEAAAQELAAVHDEFARTMLVGSYARLYEGRCYQALENYQLALGCYEDLLGKDNVLPAFRKLIAAATHRKAEILVAQDKLNDAIEACNALLKESHKDEDKQPEWLAVRYRLAESLAKKAAAAPADSLERRRTLNEAREAYRFVSRVPGEFQVAARAAMTTTPGNVVPTSGTVTAKEKEEPRTFQAAYDMGKDGLSAYSAAKQAIPSAQRNNPSAVPELEEQMKRGKEDARRYFQIAATLIEDDTDTKQVNEVRYFLCWLYWEAQDFYRAAVLGEFLARHYPDHPSASSAAKLSMAAYERLLNQTKAAGNKNGQGDFEARHTAQLAELIVRRWPGTADADSAFGVLVGFAIRNGKVNEAEKMLDQVSPQSRPRLELLLGNALWGRYLEVAQSSAGGSAGVETVTALKTTALKHLTTGFDAARKESQLSEPAAMAALYMVQALLSDGKYDEAINLIEDKSVGPLALIATEHPAATPQYAIEAYKAALRAYVSASPPQEEKAMTTMKALEKVVQAGTDGANAAEQLTRIYVGMGSALQKQMQDLRNEGKGKEADRVVAAFSGFLNRIAEKTSDANWPTRAWLAQMYFAIGAGDSLAQREATAALPAKLDKTDRDYLMKSRDMYQKLLAEAASDPKVVANPASVTAAKVQLAECYRMLGQYQEALDTFFDVLKDKEASLAVQRAAAMAYQQRGQDSDAKFLESAIYGGYPVKPANQNRIWGWLKISQVVSRYAARDAKFRDAFYEARLNISRCRYFAAMKQTGDVRRQDLNRAKESVQSLARLYPDLGGEKWKPAFDQLIQQIQREEGKLTKPAKKS